MLPASASFSMSGARAIWCGCEPGNGGPARSIIDQQIVPKAELLASDYYNGFMKPRDMHTVMRLTLAHRDKFLTIISLVRPLSADEFDAAAIERCRVLMPHLQRAAISGSRRRRRCDAGRAFRCRRPLGHGGAAAGARRAGEVCQQGGTRHGGRRGRVSCSATISSKYRIETTMPHFSVLLRGRWAGCRTSTHRAAASCALHAARVKRATPSPLRR